MMKLRYRCPFTNKIILEADIEAIRFLNGKTPCPDCGVIHPLPICPREVLNDDNLG